MRLSAAEVETIRSCFSEIFHEGRISLFGSRTDDSKKGGDIDLFIEVADTSDVFVKKITFLARLKRKIGDRKIDVVIAEDGSRLIEREARKWAIQL